METNQTEKEKISRMVTGLESDAKCVPLRDDVVQLEYTRTFHNDVESKLESLKEHTNKVSKVYESLKEEALQIAPIANNIIVKPYTDNPFQRIVKDNTSGLIVDLGGLAPEYKSHEDGQIHEEESFIHVGLVTEVGPDVKWVHKDDVVMWTKPSELPIPFFKQGLLMINEVRVMAVVSTDLKKRGLIK